ncbi:hypothetical protein [Oceanivirga salmonicida]|uniref:hypothetical protein n=1 Tax=Oceanivirga salmonicida TaxID=1769291 RepID=UPI00082CFCFE|nr:hypothetical protein [Oceanivirga salmonicida]
MKKIMSNVIKITFYTIIIAISTIILNFLIRNIAKYTIGDNSLYIHMYFNNMEIDEREIYSNKELSFSSAPPIYAYLKKIKPIKKEYFYKGRFNIYTDTHANPKKIIEGILLNPYIFNELIYDKNVGNNFEKVEEYILNEGSKYNIFLGRYKKNKKEFYKLLNIEANFKYKLNKKDKIYCIIEECYELKNAKLKLLEKHNYDLYGKLIKEEEYFLKSDKKIEILKINPEEYMEKFDIYPIIVISYDEKWELSEEFIEGIRNAFNKNMNLNKIGLIIESVDFHE